MQKFGAYLSLIRFFQPVGTWLLFFPCLFALLLSQKHFPSFIEVGMFFIGAFLMRSAGCIINDLWDRKLDRMVERTKNRPLASGAISVFEAFFLLFLFLLFGFLLLLQFNSFTVKLGFVSVAFIASYPLMKRITWYPQIFLGITFNLGVLFVYGSRFAYLPLDAIILYLGCVCWTIGFDTIYAYQDIYDDLSVGIKSTAIKFANQSKKIILSLYIIFLLSLLIVGIKGGYGFMYFASLNLISFIILSNIQLCDFTDVEQCANEFRRNSYYGVLLVLIMSVGKIVY